MPILDASMYFNEKVSKMSPKEQEPFMEKLLLDTFSLGVGKEQSWMALMRVAEAHHELHECLLVNCQFLKRCREMFKTLISNMGFHPYLSICLNAISVLIREYIPSDHDDKLILDNIEFFKEIIIYFVIKGWKRYHKLQRLQKKGFLMGVGTTFRIISSMSILLKVDGSIENLFRKYFWSMKKRLFKNIVSFFFLLLEKEDINNYDCAFKVMSDLIRSIENLLPENSQYPLQKEFNERMMKEHVVEKIVKLVKYSISHLDTKKNIYPSFIVSALDTLEVILFLKEFRQTTKSSVMIIQDLLLPLAPHHHELEVWKKRRSMTSTILPVLCPLVQFGSNELKHQMIHELGIVDLLLDVFGGKYGETHYCERYGQEVSEIHFKDDNLVLRILQNLLPSSLQQLENDNYLSRKLFIDVEVDRKISFLESLLDRIMHSFSDPSVPINAGLVSLYRHAFLVLRFPFSMKDFPVVLLEKHFLSNGFLEFVMEYCKCFPPRVLKNLDVVLTLCILPNKYIGKRSYYRIKNSLYFSNFWLCMSGNRGVKIFYLESKNMVMSIGVNLVLWLLL